MKLPSGDKSIAVIAGGFHTEGLSRKLKEAGVSHLIISPALGGDEMDEKAYIENIRSYYPEENALAFFLRYLNADFDERFFRGMQIYEQDNNLILARETAKGVSSVSAAGEIRAGSGAAFSEILSASRDEQLEWARSLLVNTGEASQRQVLIITAADLASLLENPVGRILGTRELSNRSNTFVILYENMLDIPDATIGARARIDRIRASSVNEAVSESSFQTRYKTERAEARVAAVLPVEEALLDAEILKLQPSPVSFLFRLLLERPELRGATSDEAFFNLLESLLAEIDRMGELGKSA